MRASVCASSVLPQPVGPRSRMLDFWSSMSSRPPASSARACSGCRPPPRACAWPAPGRRRTPAGPRRSPSASGGSRWRTGRRRGGPDGERAGAGELLVDDLVAEIDALVADVDAGAGDELLDLPLRLAAEAAKQLFVRVGGTSHRPLLKAACPACSELMLRDHPID